MSDRYKLVIDQAGERGNDPQLVEGALAIVIAALHEYTKYPRHDLIELKVTRCV